MWTPQELATIHVAQRALRDLIANNRQPCSTCADAFSFWRNQLPFDSRGPILSDSVIALLQAVLHHGEWCHAVQLNAIRAILLRVVGKALPLQVQVYAAPNASRGACMICRGQVLPGAGRGGRIGYTSGAICSSCAPTAEENARESFLRSWRHGEARFERSSNPKVGYCARCANEVGAGHGYLCRCGMLVHLVCRSCHEKGFPIGGDGARGNPDLSYLAPYVVERLRNYPFQLLGVERLQKNGFYLLADDMGLGKTGEAYCALAPGVPVLVVAPANVQINHVAELHGDPSRQWRGWREEFAVCVAKGRKEFRWPKPGEVVIARWDSLPRVVAPLEEGEKQPKKRTWMEEDKALQGLIGPAPPGIVVIFDEGHYAKNPAAERTRNARAISRATRRAGGKIWVMTGTPMLNKPPELWHVLRLAGLHSKVAESWAQFKAMSGAEIVDQKLVWREAKPELRFKLGEVMLRRLADDVLDLPPVVREVEFLDLSAEAVAECEAVMKWAGGEVEFMSLVEATLGKGKGGKRGNELLEILARVRRIIAAAKMPRLLECVAEAEERKEPCAVFSVHRGPVEILSQRPGWGAILGGMSAEDRYEVVNAFQAGELRGIGFTLAGCEGINLTRARIMYRVSLDWTPARNEQGLRRLLRIGTREPVRVIDLVGEHPVERMVHAILLMKEKRLRAAGLELTRQRGEADGNG